MSDAVWIALGVVLERRSLDNPWQDHAWKPVAVVQDAAVEGTEWKVVAEGDGWTRFLAGPLNLELYPRETEGYKHNLSTREPRIFVVLRQNEESDGPEVEPFLITACPYEAQDYLDSGEEIVEGVPMLPEIATWISEFVERHHVDEVFVKRKNRKHRDRQRPRPTVEGCGHA